MPRRTDLNPAVRSILTFILLVAVSAFAGDFRVRGAIAGRVEKRIGGSMVGRFERNGDIRVKGSIQGCLEGGGSIRKNGSSVGRVESNGNVRKGGSIIGHVTGMTQQQAAALFFFGFFDVR